MKYLLLFLILIPSIAHSQANIQADITAKQADITLHSGIINADNVAIANAQADIVVQQAAIASDNSAISLDTVENNSYNAATAQTPAQVNWADIDNLEINDIRYAQWQAARSGENWPNIISLLQVGGCTTETAVNWNNFNTCVANGVNMNQPLGNWPYGFSSFWCGNGKITGTC